MIEEKLRARQQRQRPLPHAKCEHVAADIATHRTRIIREGLVIDVCDQCWASDEKRLSYDGQPRTVVERAAEQWMQNRLTENEGE